eukprot:Amastigsp_a339260_716.p2 type:complete len:241 gc:universal Amastigsp_a339260_716:756-34(-)
MIAKISAMNAPPGPHQMENEVPLKFPVCLPDSDFMYQSPQCELVVLWSGWLEGKSPMGTVTWKRSSPCALLRQSFARALGSRSPTIATERNAQNAAAPAVPSMMPLRTPGDAKENTPRDAAMLRYTPAARRRMQEMRPSAANARPALSTGRSFACPAMVIDLTQNVSGACSMYPYAARHMSVTPASNTGSLEPFGGFPCERTRSTGSDVARIITMKLPMTATMVTRRQNAADLKNDMAAM